MHLAKSSLLVHHQVTSSASAGTVVLVFSQRMGQEGDSLHWITVPGAGKLFIPLPSLDGPPFSLSPYCSSKHRQQPTRLSRPWDSPGKNTGVGCHFLLYPAANTATIPEGMGVGVFSLPDQHPALWAPAGAAGTGLHKLLSLLLPLNPPPPSPGRMLSLGPSPPH